MTKPAAPLTPRASIFPPPHRFTQSLAPPPNSRHHACNRNSLKPSSGPQRNKGVSLQEQKDAITRYAERNGLPISAWFEEKETAAKRGRPVFGEVLERLRRGEVRGLLIHKIDRSARNLKDWADLGDLIDEGIDVHFANESLDLNSRGGRLSADIQAVVAADYVRNLREETKKGMYGRLKQGFYPLPAPIGYLDQGKAKPKTLDPKRAPIIRRLFHLYASGDWTLKTLRKEAERLGLRTRRGDSSLSLSGLSTVLNNPFYTGIIRIRSTRRIFQGVHEPLIPASLFQRVQDVLQGKTQRRTQVHDFLYRRLLRCGHCGYSLIGELQKRTYVYYRCQRPDCPTTTVREERVDEAFKTLLSRIQLSDEEMALLRQAIEEAQSAWYESLSAARDNLHARLAAVEVRLDRITDAYVDTLIDRDIFEHRKEKLLFEKQRLTEKIADLEAGSPETSARVSQFLELLKSASLLNEAALPFERRRIIEAVTSNRVVEGREPVFTLSEPFATIANRPESANSTPYRCTPRTLQIAGERVFALFLGQVSQN